MSRVFYTTLVLIAFFSFSTPVKGQFLKKLKEKVEKAAEETIDKGVDRASKSIFEGDKQNDADESEKVEEVKETINDKKTTTSAEANTPASVTKSDESEITKGVSISEIGMSHHYSSTSDSLFVLGNDIKHAGNNQVVQSGIIDYKDPQGRTREIHNPLSYVSGASGYYCGHYNNQTNTNNAKYGFIDKPVYLFRQGGDFRSSPFNRLRDTDEIIYISSDLRRAVFIRDGDIWRAEFDWLKGDYVNLIQVTSLGLFENKKLLFWYKNDLYLDGGFSETEPIVCIDLMSGNITELADHDVFSFDRKSSGFINPSGSILCHPGKELLYCYNAETRTFFRIPNMYENEHGGLINLVLPGSAYQGKSRTEEITWLRDDVFAFVNTHSGVISRFDLSTRKRAILFAAKREKNEFVERAVILPGGRWVELKIITGIKNSLKLPDIRRLLLDFTNGEITPIGLSDDADGKWLNDQIYFYSKEEGGLSQVGTWIYDRKTNENKRIANVIPGNVVGMTAIAFPRFDAIYFTSHSGKLSTYRASISEGKSIKITDDLYPYPIIVPSVDLGIGSNSRPAWSSSQSLTAPIAVDNSLPESELPSTGMEKLLQATKDMSQEHQEEVIKAYENASREYSVMNSYYDPVCVSLNFWEIRKTKLQEEEFQLTWSKFATNLSNYESCLDESRIRQYAAARTKRIIQTRDLSDERKEEIQNCVSQKMVDQLKAHPIASPRAMDNLFIKLISECLK